MNATTKITVTYRIGTTQYTGHASTYRGAMRLASKNQNAYDPRFYKDGKELHDTGYGLAYVEPDAQGRIVCVV